jgi:hypothetical protein
MNDELKFSFSIEQIFVFLGNVIPRPVVGVFTKHLCESNADLLLSHGWLVETPTTGQPIANSQFHPCEKII